MLVFMFLLDTLIMSVKRSYRLNQMLYIMHQFIIDIYNIDKSIFMTNMIAFMFLLEQYVIAYNSEFIADIQY